METGTSDLPRPSHGACRPDRGHPHEPVPENILPGYAGGKPLLVGHYWLTGEPAPLNHYIACLDYSIAAGHTQSAGEGKLCAYRWDGERKLTKDTLRVGDRLTGGPLVIVVRRRMAVPALLGKGQDT
ncbi:hypothetical protein SAMN04487959_1384 [Modicisalibacter xianhensis]|uniref:Uncharacterized protein n=1 Tax=Modicisalibacter xianhensis TaxID=442341 RepID=A0A1I3GPX5_9GAMM|nr:hypothetical protein SAMN04487959_1384 [Halomonas xianhensis]